MEFPTVDIVLDKTNNHLMESFGVGVNTIIRRLFFIFIAHQHKGGPRTRIVTAEQVIWNKDSILMETRMSVLK